MVALDEFWPKSVGAIRSITMEVVTAIFALASLSSLLIASRVSLVCTSLNASELWQFMLSVSAAPAILIGMIIAARMRQTLTGLKITHEELVSLAMIDGLTGLLNRPGFDAVAADVLEETPRLGQPVSALVCDIDAFRGLNDRYGHEAGDRALRNLAEVLEEAIGRRPAILGRQGGDEFVILLPGIDLKDAVTIAEDICETCEARALVQQEPAAKFTISVGVGTEASGASELGGLLRQSDAALYRAKRAGGNQVASGPGRLVRRQSAPDIERVPMRSAKPFVPRGRHITLTAWLTLPSCLANSSSPTLARMIFCSLVIVGVLSKRRGRAMRTPTTPRPASASASAMTPTVRLSLNYCRIPPLHQNPMKSSRSSASSAGSMSRLTDFKAFDANLDR
jgi:diguanylate cyclase (GGDEF)-like protein